MFGKVLVIVFLILMVTYVTLKIIELVVKHRKKKKAEAEKKALEDKKDVGSVDPGCVPGDQVDKR